VDVVPGGFLDEGADRANGSTLTARDASGLFKREIVHGRNAFVVASPDHRENIHSLNFGTSPDTPRAKDAFVHVSDDGAGGLVFDGRPVVVEEFGEDLVGVESVR
jgi:hypothetical protein